MAKNLINDKGWMGQAFRFAIVGVVSTLTTYAIYYILLSVVNLNIAYTTGYIVGIIVNFFLSTSFTFKVKASAKNGAGFIISNIINYALSLFLLNLFVRVGLSDELAPIPMYMICIPTNFLIVRFVMKK